MTMTAAQENLHQLLSALQDFAETLVEEERILRTLDINHLMLQSVIEKKILIIQSISSYENQRRQNEKNRIYYAPYLAHRPLALLWEEIVIQTKRTKQLIEKTQFTLNMQVDRVIQIQDILRKNILQKDMYNTDGTQACLRQNALGPIII